MPIQISLEQFELYQQQWNQPVEDGDLEGRQQKTNAAYWLAYCYLHAEGGVIQGDRDQAIPILEQAIREQDRMDDNNNHDKTGKHRYLRAHLIGLRRNQQRAKQLYRQAFQRLETEVQEGGNDENFQEAAFLFGACLFFGKGGVDKDPSRGIHCWKAAAELGYENALRHLFIWCSEEPYVAEVFDWWLEMASAEHEHVWIQMALGECFQYGRGVEKDLVKSVEWYNKAATQGDYHASLSMQGLLNRLSPEERNKTLGCVTRNQKIEKVEHLIEQPEPGSVPLGLWADVIATLQRQEHPPWESPSPTYLALSRGVISQLQDQSPNRKRSFISED